MKKKKTNSYDRAKPLDNGSSTRDGRRRGGGVKIDGEMRTKYKTRKMITVYHLVVKSKA